MLIDEPANQDEKEEIASVERGHPKYATRAQIEPTALRQAMTRAQVDETVLAKRIGTKPHVVASWLEGTKKPTFRQAMKAAERTRIPFGFLFLKNLPPDVLPIPDFRVLSGSDRENISLDLREVIESTLLKQSWLSEYMESEDAEKSDFVGKGQIDDSVDDLAEGISSALNISAVAKTNNPEDYLRSLVQQVEQTGINVLRSGIVGNNHRLPLDAKEFRGFALSDQYAPFVFINSNDSKQAQIFTLIHELCHLWCNQTGISDSSNSSIINELRSDSYESKCNRVAAEILAPRVDILHQWNKKQHTNLHDSLKTISEYFHVSKLVILIKLREHLLISQQDFEMTYNNISHTQDKNPAGKGDDHHTNIAIRNGNKFTEIVLNAMLNQHLLLRDAAGLLNISVAQVVKMSEQL